MTLITAESTIIPIVFFAVNIKNILNIKNTCTTYISEMSDKALVHAAYISRIDR
jgi:hypothetical protein